MTYHYCFIRKTCTALQMVALYHVGIHVGGRW